MLLLFEATLACPADFVAGGEVFDGLGMMGDPKDVAEEIEKDSGNYLL